MEGTEVRRWRRFGHDRLYVTVADKPIGHRDLTTGQDHAQMPEHAAALAGACDAWLANEEPDPGRVAEVEAEPSAGGRVASASERIETPEPTDPSWDDLSRNAPGQGVREEAIAEWAQRKEEKPIRAVLGRVLDVHNDERAWRMGAIGEEAVGRRLEKYAEKDPRWHFLHSVPVGSKGSDIDHVAIGPGGVFTINSKHHDGAKIWLAGRTLMVNGRRQPYLRNSHHEATRATRLLAEHLGWQPPVAAVLALVGVREITVKSDPEDVDVVTARRLPRWLKRRPEVLTEDQVAEVYDVARRSSTWT